MSFGSVRGYVQLASGLGELTRMRAMEAAQGLLSLPGMGIAGGKLAVQAGALAEELLAAATTNRELLTTLVRHEVDAAVTRLGLVPAEELERARAEAAQLRAELAALRSASNRSTSASGVAVGVAKRPAAKKPPERPAAKKSPAGPAAKRSAARGTAVAKSAAPRAAAKKSAVRKSVAKTSVAKKSAVKQAAATTAAKPTKAPTTAGPATRTAARPRPVVGTPSASAGT